jgi:hypothetical protein
MTLWAMLPVHPRTRGANRLNYRRLAMDNQESITDDHFRMLEAAYAAWRQETKL